MAWWEEAAAASPRAVPIRCSALHWGWEEMEDSQGETPGFSQPCQANSDRKAGPEDETSCQAAEGRTRELHNTWTTSSTKIPNFSNASKHKHPQKHTQRTQDPLLSTARTLCTSLFSEQPKDNFRTSDVQKYPPLDLSEIQLCHYVCTSL